MKWQQKACCLLLGIVLLYAGFKMAVLYYQRGRVFEVPAPIQLKWDERRFARCLPPPPPFSLRTNRSVLCVPRSESARVVQVGVVVEGPLLTTFVERLLALESGWCHSQGHIPAVKFVRFSPRDVLEGMDGWLLIGEHFDEPLHYPALSGRYGRIGLGAEHCQNRKIEDAPVFGFVTYGDCAIVDHRRFFPFPLGPLFEGHRDYPFFQPAVRSMRDRPILLDAAFSITPSKPSRMTCTEQAQQWCYGERCRLGMDWMYYMLPTAIYERIWGSNSHFESLESTKVVLCPAGNHAEQYRIWETILAGAIPIVEDTSHPMASPWYVSPAFPDAFGCVPSDIHPLLKGFDAPVLYVRDWTELGSVLHHLRGKEQVLQDALLAWRSAFFLHWKLLLYEIIREEWGPVEFQKE